MAFYLTVRRPDGTGFVDNDGSGAVNATKLAACLAVLRVFVEEGVHISVSEARCVGKELLNGTTGTPRTHHASGYVFTVKEI